MAGALPRTPAGAYGNMDGVPKGWSRSARCERVAAPCDVCWPCLSVLTSGGVLSLPRCLSDELMCEGSSTKPKMLLKTTSLRL